MLDLRRDVTRRCPVRRPSRRLSESPIAGRDAAKWFTSRVNTGTISATKPASAAKPSSSPSVAPIARGTRRRWSMSANADSGVAMIATISTPSTRLASAWKIIPAITSPNASSTAL